MTNRLMDSQVKCPPPNAELLEERVVCGHLKSIWVSFQYFDFHE